MTEGFGCRDCGLDTLEAGEYYMVHREVWELTGLEGSGGMLCIGCLESRLGRRLIPGDFMTCPLNHDGAGLTDQSDRLRNRLDRPTTT